MSVFVVVCGLWTAGVGGYVAIVGSTSSDIWPDAAPIIADQTAKMTVATANRIWWTADDLWRKETVLTSFEIMKPPTGRPAMSVELPKSGAAIEPALRMAVGISPQQNPKVTIAVSSELRGLLGEGCIEQAVQPLLEREARNGLWDYVAGLGIAFAAAKATFLTDLIWRSEYLWLPIGSLASLLGLIFLITRQRSAANDDTKQSLLSALRAADSRLVSLSRTIEAREEEQQQIKTRLEVAEAALAEAQRASDAPSWAIRLPGLRWVTATANQRRVSKLKANAQHDRDALKDVQKNRASMEDEYNDRVARTVETVERRKARMVTRRRMAALCTLIVIIFAGAFATYDALAIAAPNMRRTPTPGISETLLPGSLLYSALESNRDLIEPFRNRCGIEVTVPKPIEMQPVSLPGRDMRQPEEPRSTATSKANVAPDVNNPTQPHCSIGKPCGQSCIPQDHICHIDSAQTVHHAQDRYTVRGYFRANGTYVAPYARHYPARRK